MNLSRAIAVLLVVGLVVGAMPAVWSLSTSTQIQDDVPVSTPQTPTITLSAPNSADVNLRDYAQGSRMVLNTSEGNVTISGDPGANATLAVSDIEGTQTELTAIDAGGNWINVTPYDKNRMDVRGDADTLAFEEIAVDDGNTDMQLGGPQGGTAELRLYGLAANTEYALYDSSRDEVFGNFTTDGSGVGQTNVDMPDGTQALQVRTAGSFNQPTVTNPSPTGQVTTKPDTVSADVTAAAWPATVEFRVDGQLANTKTVTSNGTVTHDVSSEVDSLGEYDYTVTVTDGVGATDSVSASFETPSAITLREEHAPQQVITNASTTLRFFTTGGDVAVERSVGPNGEINMTGLPDSSFVVFAEGPNHYDRAIFVESIFQQETMFLLNETIHPRGENEAVRSRFVYEDLTGNYPKQDTTIRIERALDVNGDNTNQYRTVAGDFWGASSEFEVILQRGTRYRIVIENQATGQQTIEGSHIPTEELTQTISISGLVINATQAQGVVALAEYNASTQQIELAYSDPIDQTDPLRVRVVSQSGNQTLLNDTVGGPLGQYSTTVALNDSQAEQNWIVEFDAGARHRSAIPVGSGSIALPVAVPGWILTLLMTMGMTFVGLLYGPRTALLGAWSMVFVAGAAAMFGWAFSAPAVLVAGVTAAGFTILGRAVP